MPGRAEGGVKDRDIWQARYLHAIGRHRGWLL